MVTHARLSPSNHRWPHCAGSVREEANYPDNSGDAAIDGTGSHLLVELCLKTGDPKIKATRYLGQTIGIGHPDKPAGWVIDKERCERVQVALDYVQHRDSELGGVTVTTESPSNPGQFFGRSDWWGTCDITLQGLDSPILEVIDYKDGFMYVDAKDNSQLTAYAGGKLEAICRPLQLGTHEHPDNPIKTVRMTIIQPKIAKQPIRFVEMTATEVWQACIALNAAAEATDKPDAPLCAGDWCQWCKHKENCPERAAKGLEGVGMMVESSSPLFETLQKDQLPVSEMPAIKIAAILDAKPMIEALLKNVSEEAEKRLKAGEDVPGYTMAAGKGKNVWKDDLEMVEKKLAGMRFLKADIYPTSFVSPAQALKKKDLTERQIQRIKEELIEYIEGSPKVVKSNFKRQTADEMFADPLPITAIDVTPAPEPQPKDEFEGLSFL